MNLRSLTSLRGRALIATALGLAVLAGLVVFDNYYEGRLVVAQAHADAVHRLDTDNRALARAVTDSDAALLTYTTSVSTSPGTREELLAEYLQASDAVTAAEDRVTRDAAAAGLAGPARPVKDAADAYQAWAHATRVAYDARSTGGQPAISPAEGARLLDTFDGAELSFNQAIVAANQDAQAVQQQRNAEHLRFFYGGLLVEALVVLLLAIAVVHGLLNPIGRLTRAAAALAAGRPTRVPFVEREDEVGSLARALAAWQQAASDVASVFQHSPLGMARLDAAGVVLEANPSLHRMLPRVEFLEHEYGDVLDPEQRSEFASLLQSLAAGERDSFAMEVRHVSPIRSPFWGHLTVAAVPASDGEWMAYALLMLEDIELRKTQELELAHRAAHDPLTGLPNRLLFRDRLEQALRAARRRRGRLAVLLIDLDRFKPVNDQFGHHAGDVLLQQLSGRMRAALREADTLARIGGDEFAVVLGQEGQEGAVAAARKLLEAVEPDFDIDGVRCSIGLSIGIATYPADGSTAEALVRRADTAMYSAKRGRLGFLVAGAEHKAAAAL